MRARITTSYKFSAFGHVTPPIPGGGRWVDKCINKKFCLPFCEEKWFLTSCLRYYYENKHDEGDLTVGECLLPFGCGEILVEHVRNEVIDEHCSSHFSTTENVRLSKEKNSSIRNAR